jgi:hypothetical protein
MQQRHSRRAFRDTEANVLCFTLLTALGLGAAACGESPSPCGKSTQRDDGLALCENGLVHRPSTAVTCTSRLPRPDEEVIRGGGNASSMDQCTKDTECTQRAHGACVWRVDQLEGDEAFVCEYGCLTDNDCAEGTVCVCGDFIGACMQAECTSDADCPDDLLCSEWGPEGVCDFYGDSLLQCQTSKDECAVRSDCDQGEHGATCVRDGGRHVCLKLDGTVCGRPFLVNGVPRLASLNHEIVDQTSVAPPPSANISELSPTEREQVGQYWMTMGLMEHASIAAFARFALQLMHVGAPLSLLEAAQQAMVDETEHTKACFSIASTVSGKPLSPGKLSITDAFDTDLETIVRLTIREGCIGETVAALLAAEAHRCCDAAAIRATLSKIQADESRHAELAWRFVQWALDQYPTLPNGTALDDVVAEEFEHAMRQIAQEHPQHETTRAVEAAELGAFGSRGDRSTCRYGVVFTSTQRNIHDTALRAVVEPCARALLYSVAEKKSRGAAAYTAMAV